MDYIYKCSNITKSYRIANQAVTHVLKGLSLEIVRGEFLAIVGPSGVGKSTLLHIVGSLDTPENGELSYNFENIWTDIKSYSSEQLAEIRNKHIGFVFQFHHLLPEFTSIENIMIPAFIAGLPYKQALGKAKSLLHEVGIENKSDNKPMELSGGEQQRVAIARALINNPSIVLADEPTGNLDKDNSESVMELIRKLQKDYNLTFVVATHSNEIASRADRVVKMSDGLIA